MANIRVGRRSGLVLRGGRQRRSTLWAGITDVNNALPNVGSAVITNVTGAALLALRPFTIVRIRGEMYVSSDQSAAAENQLVAWGTCVVSDQASAIGVTAIPTPITDSDSDLWFMYQVAINAVGAGDVNNIRGHQVSIDSKAMRKVEEGQELLFVAERGLTGGGVTLVTQGRALIKLH